MDEVVAGEWASLRSMNADGLSMSWTYGVMESEDNEALKR